MNKRQPNKLNVYRRHAGKCPAKKAPKLDKCSCPLWVHGRVRGEFIRQSLDTRDLAKAYLMKDEIMRRGGDAPTPDGGVAVMPKGAETLEYAAKEFLTTKRRRATGTRTLYKRAVDHFVTWAEKHELTTLGQIELPHIQKYFSEFDPQWERSTSQARLTHLRVFFNYCKKTRRWIQYAPTDDRDLNYGTKSKGGKVTKKREPFTPAEVTAILAAIDRLRWRKRRDPARALILLLLYTGMRISDATFFEREYVKRVEAETDGVKSSFDTADYYVIKTRRQIDLPPEMQQELLGALAKPPKTRTYFFQPDADNYNDARVALRNGEEFSELMPMYKARIQATTGLVQAVLKVANVKGGAHRFRDTFAVNLLVHGVDIFTVSQMLGHSDVRITQEHYVNFIPGYRERMSQRTRSLVYAFPQPIAA